MWFYMEWTRNYFSISIFANALVSGKIVNGLKKLKHKIHNSAIFQHIDFVLSEIINISNSIKISYGGNSLADRDFFILDIIL